VSTLSKWMRERDTELEHHVLLCGHVCNNVTMKVPVFVIFEVSESSLNVESDKHHYVHVEISNCQHVGT